MSFCKDIKNELAGIKVFECCKLPLAYGLMLFGRSFSIKRISMQTNNRNTAEYYASLLEGIFGVNTVISEGGSVRPTYKAEVVSEADRLKILASYDFGIAENPIDLEIIDRECCFQSFVRGAFLACGNINDPEKEYRAEFMIRNGDTANNFWELLSSHGITLKRTQRGKTTVLYTKESGLIEDLLTLMGIPHRTLDFIDTKIMKSVKNNINRANNCDSANISKTVEASIKQRAAIEYLRKTDRLDSLPEELIKAANLRESNPEATLKELCTLSDEYITVSGLNHRLNKIIGIYNELKKP
ncbi:MAG: DNA-binding protein WhiA [Acutalibacteraceae bacterium]|nr:DNA-binding protein WhiA [Acutalibacteraceae bacterium]